MKKQIRYILQQIPWKGVIVILSAGILISGGMILHAHTKQDQASVATPDMPIYTVTFLDDRGEILEQQQVPEGGFAVPPAKESPNNGMVFRGWSQKLYDINRSTEVTPVYQDLRNEKNAFYIDSQCAQLGEEVTTDLWLCGNVCLSSIQLSLEYDPNVLLDLKCDTAGSPFTVVSTEPGAVILRLDETQNLTGLITVASICFSINPESDTIAKTRIRIDMEDPAMMKEGGEVGADSCAVHSDIFLLS